MMLPVDQIRAVIDATGHQALFSGGHDLVARIARLSHDEWKIDCSWRQPKGLMLRLA